ncbi:MAG: shikimate dehydrogenase [Planctomycetota bacterium]|jgi:3-dehydroquinate dehydratase/shikimate dehydrogenase
MICVSIGRGRHSNVIAVHRQLAEQGAKLVELRLDYISGPVNVKQLLSDRPCPAVITCRRRRDGGKFPGRDDERLVLLRTAIAEGVEYVDLEEDVAPQIPRFGTTKRIVSHHDFRKTPDDLEEIHGRLCGLDPDVVKVCTMANRPSDNLRMLRLVEKSDVPTVGICMGDMGIPSRVLTGRFGAPFTFATFSEERALAPGQLSFEQMTRIYRYEQIDRKTDVYGVIADPVGHSLSPLIHNAAFEQSKLNKVYLPFRVPREELPRFIDEAPGLGIKGLSVTIPHKEAVLEKLTETDEGVRGIGAANTVVFDHPKRLGYNTDYSAAMGSLEEAMRVAGQDQNPLEGKVALVLGAGGVGKAIAFGLVGRQAKVVLTDGVPEVAQALAERLGCHATDWPRRHAVSADVLVNCTPVGMHPNVDETPFDKHHLRPGMVVFDAIYNPENTLLIKDARARNCKVITGVDMFVRQACLQFEYFTGHDGPAELMRDVIKRATAAAKH